MSSDSSAKDQGLAPVSKLVWSDSQKGVLEENSRLDINAAGEAPKALRIACRKQSFAPLVGNGSLREPRERAEILAVINLESILSMLTKPAVLLRMEGFALLAASVFLYRQIHASWILFAILFLGPDLFMLGYLLNPRVGAAVYNFVHTLFAPAILVGVVYFAAQPRLLPFAVIWIAHIGFDRMQGYGLKYPTFFKDTHLQRV